MAQGRIFNIQHFSVHDGPGIRTIVFLKGCPLRCLWCSNPESHSSSLEIAYNPLKCIGEECKLCLNVCDRNAISWNEDLNLPRINFNLCNDCLSCADVCPSKAISVYGELMDENAVMDIVEKDMSFYSRSGGGVTFSGGEPLMQREFLLAALKEAKRRGINTAIETSGYSDWDEVEEIFSLLDYILIDLKHTDDEKHRKFTGVSNEKILKNLKSIGKNFPDKKVHVRTPVIPTFNDTQEELQEIHQFVEENLPNAKYELLKFHDFGRNKYDFIGKRYELGKDLEITEEEFKDFQDRFDITKK